MSPSDQGVQGFSGPLCDSLNPAIVQVAHPASEAKLLSLLLRTCAIPDPLHSTLDQKVYSIDISAHRRQIHLAFAWVQGQESSRNKGPRQQYYRHVSIAPTYQTLLRFLLSKHPRSKAR